MQDLPSEAAENELLGLLALQHDPQSNVLPSLDYFVDIQAGGACEQLIISLPALQHRPLSSVPIRLHPEIWSRALAIPRINDRGSRWPAAVASARGYPWRSHPRTAGEEKLTHEHRERDLGFHDIPPPPQLHHR